MAFLHGKQLVSAWVQSFGEEGQLGGVRGWPWLYSKCSPKPVYHSPPQLDKGKENIVKDLWAERSLTTGKPD